MATIVTIIAIATISWWTGLSSALSLLRDLTGPADVQSQSAAYFLAPYRFPASIVWILSTGLWLNYGMLYLAVATTGGEYAWATIRNVLLNVTRRTDYLVGRIAFLAGLGFLLVL